MNHSIVLADDHPIVLRGVRSLLESQQDFSILGEAGDGLEAIRAAERLQPDVLILDLMMSGLSGLEVLRIVRQRSPRTRVVILSMHSTTAFVVEALKNGASAFVLKGGAEGDLIRAVREAIEGRRFLSSAITQTSMEAYIAHAQAAPIDPYDTLTAREREVLQLVAEGQTSLEIAERLHISNRTVENHRANLKRKLGLPNQSELVRHALRHGLIPLEE